MFLFAFFFATTLQMTWVPSSRQQFNSSSHCHQCRHGINVDIFIAISIINITIVIVTTIFNIAIGMIAPMYNYPFSQVRFNLPSQLTIVVVLEVFVWVSLVISHHK